MGHGLSIDQRTRRAVTGPPTLPRALNQSVFARLTLGFVVLALLSFAAMIFAAHYTVASARDEAVQRLVDNDLAGLADIYASGGFKELSARVGDRIALPPVAAARVERDAPPAVGPRPDLKRSSAAAALQ